MNNGPFRKEVRVNLAQGMHMIPCSRIAEIARDTDCQVRVLLDEQIADARNVLDLLMLKAEEGTSLLIESEGEGAEEILARVVKLFENNFGLSSEK